VYQNSRRSTVRVSVYRVPHSGNADTWLLGLQSAGGGLVRIEARVHSSESGMSA
jgi:hypothetical protein